MGVTADLIKRVWQHRSGDVEGSRKRLWKLQLIETANPHWRDLYPDIL